MQTVTLQFTNDDARYIASFLRTRYGKDGRTKLAQLCKMAVKQETGRQAQKELEKAEQEPERE